MANNPTARKNIEPRIDEELMKTGSCMKMWGERQTLESFTFSIALRRLIR